MAHIKRLFGFLTTGRRTMGRYAQSALSSVTFALL